MYMRQSASLNLEIVWQWIGGATHLNIHVLSTLGYRAYEETWSQVWRAREKISQTKISE